MLSNIGSESTGRVLPASNAFAITPSDTDDLPQYTRGLYVGGAGTVVVLMADDEATVAFVAVPTGSLLPLRVQRVMNGGTTATNIVGVY